MTLNTRRIPYALAAPVAFIRRPTRRAEQKRATGLATSLRRRNISHRSSAGRTDDDLRLFFSSSVSSRGPKTTPRGFSYGFSRRKPSAAGEVRTECCPSRVYTLSSLLFSARNDGTLSRRTRFVPRTHGVRVIYYDCNYSGERYTSVVQLRPCGASKIEYITRPVVRETCLHTTTGSHGPTGFRRYLLIYTCVYTRILRLREYSVFEIKKKKIKIFYTYLLYYPTSGPVCAC